MGDLPDHYEDVVWVRHKESGTVELAVPGKPGKFWVTQSGFDAWVSAEDYEVLSPLEGPEETDYRALLKRYMDHVGQSEGVYFVNRGFSNVDFTDEENAELEALIEEIQDDRD